VSQEAPERARRTSGRVRAPGAARALSPCRPARAQRRALGAARRRPCPPRLLCARARERLRPAHSVDAAAAKLTVETPGAARGGLIYQSIFRVDAHRDLAKPTLVLDPGWFDGLTINTVEPDSVTWGQQEGRNTIAIGPLAAGEHFVLRLQYQVNPTVLGHREQDVVLKDGDATLLTLPHAQTIYP
jgi:hypothetical protein